METKPPHGRTEAAPLQTRRPTTQARSFPPPRDYSSLSIRDLLDARDAYHVHLSSLQNASWPLLSDATSCIRMTGMRSIHLTTPDRRSILAFARRGHSR